jgi:hypothetical protein
MLLRRVSAVAVLAVSVLGLGAAAHADPAPGPVVLVGLPGLRAADLESAAVPALRDLAATGASGSLSVRAVRAATCPADGWLTLNAALRAGVPAACGYPTVTPTAAGGARVEGFAAIIEGNRRYGFNPRFGTFVAAAGRAGCTTAIGPGAALALADATGTVANYSPDLADPARLARCPLTVVDLGTLPAGVDRHAALVRADAALGRLRAALPPNATLFVAGIADDTDTPRLHVLLADGPRFQSGRLDARSTRQPGMVQLTDVTPTVLEVLGATPARRLEGSVVTVAPGPPDLRGQEVAADVQRAALVPFFTVLTIAILGLLAALWWARSLAARVRAAALGLAAVPAATVLANLAPWWTVGQPALALAVLIVAIAAGLAVVAALGPWHRDAWGPPAALALVTVLVLTVDAIAGSRLQLNALYGHSPMIAGRFYGFNNSTFAVYAIATVLLAAALADRPVRLGRQVRAAGIVAGIGVLAVAVDGWPAWGADFGGVLALVPVFLLLAIAVAGVRVTFGRAVLAGAAGVVVVALVSIVDWLRPAPSRSHLGAFVQRVVDGEAWAVVLRKAAQNLHTFTGNLLALLVPVAVVLVVVLLLRPERLRAERLTAAYAALPTLRAGLLAAVGVAVLGFAVNDSGATVPAMAMTLGVPLAVAIVLGVPADEPAQPTQPSGSQRTASALAT